MKSLVFIDNKDITDPATNLAIEEYVLRFMDPKNDYLMLYRNEPSVIVGRNQNILEEIDDFYARKNGIQVLRRLSGGGTVYHDPGNLNFSFITYYEQSRLHNFRFFNAPVVRILRSLGVPAEMNDRNDILADGKKISGSAQFSSRGRMMSHGTLLFNSKLEEIERILSVPMKQIRSKSHKSVRSDVANITGFLTEPMDVIAFRDRLLHGLIPDDHDRADSRYTLSINDRDRIREIRNSRYRTWQWNVGRSPRFRITRSRILNGMVVMLNLEVKKGIIEKLHLDAAQSDNAAGSPGEIIHSHAVRSIPNVTELSSMDIESGRYFLQRICDQLTGLRYDPNIIRNALENGNPEADSSQMKADERFMTGIADLLYGADE